MSPSQFMILMERFDRFEEKFGARLRRLEYALGFAVGGATVFTWLVQSGLINIKGG